MKATVRRATPCANQNMGKLTLTYMIALTKMDRYVAWGKGMHMPD